MKNELLVVDPHGDHFDVICKLCGRKFATLYLPLGMDVVGKVAGALCKEHTVCDGNKASAPPSLDPDGGC